MKILTLEVGLLVLTAVPVGYLTTLPHYRLSAKKEMDLVRTAIVQIGQLVQNSLRVNGNGAKWK
jgi:hypothetical protein